MKEKRGLSIVVTTVVLIALVLIAIAIVWVVVKNLITEKLEETESCFGNFDKVTINGYYTCYDSDSKEFQFAIDVGDIEIDAVLVLISNEGESKSFEINDSLDDGNLKPYGGAYTDSVSVPGKNAGKTYATDYFKSEPDLIKISPIIGGTQCEISDSLYDIDECLSLA